MEKQEFIQRYNDVKESVIKAMDEALTRAIGNEVIDLENEMRYSNRMVEHLGLSPYWHRNTGYQYTEENNAPVPRNVYAGY